ncbi:unnamed protein product [Soboliphyme baturini]|uniref:Uncharacterized protein n=1 Tax=Soboliphyme baturini TaxID=241478 RepID=A0A183I8Z6_9BILA|nr:unnamed protein product [Soboliphyme baturini]
MRRIVYRTFGQGVLDEKQQQFGGSRPKLHDHIADGRRQHQLRLGFLAQRPVELNKQTNERTQRQDGDLSVWCTRLDLTRLGSVRLVYGCSKMVNE